jgi:hypothetical protein
MTDVGKFIVFKPVSGGYVCRRPAGWLFVPEDHFLVTDEQKAAILAILTAPTRSLLWIMGISWIALSALSGTALSLWAYRSGYYAPGLSGVIVMMAMTLSITPTVVILRHTMLRRLRPILATLPRTSERITRLEERQQAIKARAAVTISPRRRRVVRIASAVAIAAAPAQMIARAIDMYEPNQSKLLTLYLANANPYGVINIATIVALGYVLATFGRNSIQT